MKPVSFNPKEYVEPPAQGTHEDVNALPVLDAFYEDGSPVVVSCWQPSDEDMERLKNTGRIYLVFLGNQHPAVMVTVHPEEAGI